MQRTQFARRLVMENARDRGWSDSRIAHGGRSLPAPRQPDARKRVMWDTIITIISLIIGIMMIGAGVCAVRIGVMSVKAYVREWSWRRGVLRDS